MSRQTRVDPEPLGIAVGVAGIVSGLAGAVQLYGAFARAGFRKSHRHALATLKGLIVHLGTIEEHFGEMERLVRDAFPLDVHTGWLGSRVLMVPASFRDYARHADRALVILRQVQKGTHRLERLAVKIPYVRPEAARDVVALSINLEELLSQRHAAPAVVLEGARAIVRRTQDIVRQTAAELGGSATTA